MTKHLHKYKRTSIGRKKYVVYKCILPLCTHYIEKSLVEGKLAICNKCDKPMVMTKHAMTLAKPHCLDCTNRKVKVVVSELPKEEVTDKLRQLIERMDDVHHDT